MTPHEFRPHDWAVRIVCDQEGRELSRGLVIVAAAYSDGVVDAADPLERFKPGVGGRYYRIATSRRSARDLDRLVTLIPDELGFRPDERGLEHVSQPLGRVLADLAKESSH